MFTLSHHPHHHDRRNRGPGLRHDPRRPRCHGHPTGATSDDAPSGPGAARAERSAAVRRSPAAGGRSRRAVETTFRRRRRVLGVLLAVVVAVGLMAAHEVLAGPGGVPASAAVGQPAPAVTITARPGDTLWSIAEQRRGEVPISRYVDALVDLNGGASIVAGQAVRLP